MNLPTAVRQEFVAASKAAQDERAVIGRNAFQYNVIMTRYLPARPDNAHQCLGLVRCKRATCVQSFDEDVIALFQLISSYPELPTLIQSGRTSNAHLRNQPPKFCFGHSVRISSDALKTISIAQGDLACAGVNQL